MLAKTGILLATEIRTIKVDVPIIICSGFLKAEDGEQISLLGNVISKPLKKKHF